MKFISFTAFHMKRSPRQRVLGVLAAGGLAAAGFTLAPPANAAAPTISLVSVSPGVLEAGLPYSATLVVTSTGSISVQAILVAVRDSDGDNLDFPGAVAATINGTYVYTSAAKSFAAGTYTEFGSYEIGSTWHPFAGRTLTVTAAPSSATPNPAPVGIPGAWTSTLNDGPAYSGGTTVDNVSGLLTWIGAHGAPQYPHNKTKEDDCYDPANVSQNGSFIDLSLTNAGSSDCTPPSGYIPEPYAGAQVNSDFSQQYGAFETEVYLPSAANGTLADWPAFWMVPNTGSQPWPNNGEIDAVEGLDGTAAWHFHYGTASSQLSAQASVPSIGPGWHTFGVSWEPAQQPAGDPDTFTAYTLTFYYDGTDVGSTQEPTASGELTPMALNLFLDISHNVANPVTVPATMSVAYVRAWSATSGTYYYQYKDTAGCLGVGSGGIALLDSHCASTSPNEDWKWGAEDGSTGFYQLINDGTAGNQSCLSVQGLSKSAGALTTGYTCSGTSRPDQYWKLTASTGGTYQLQDYNSKLYLTDSSGSPVQEAAGSATNWNVFAG